MPQAPDREKSGQVLVIACGALARELKSVLAASRFAHLTVVFLPAALHNRPDRIPGAVQDCIRANRAAFRTMICLYGDCGTGGELDRVLAAEGVARVPGAHCYDVFAGPAVINDLLDEEPGTFLLTDYLVRHFDRLVVQGLGIDRHPELRDLYFGNYSRVAYLSQSGDPLLLERARDSAARLGLAFIHRPTGLSQLARHVERLGV